MPDIILNLKYCSKQNKVLFGWVCKEMTFQTVYPFKLRKPLFSFNKIEIDYTREDL